jgi:hypothetical protein
VRGVGYRELNYAAQFMTKTLGVDDDAEGTASRKEVWKAKGTRNKTGLFAI